MKIDKDKRRGIIGTILFHLLLVIALWLLAFRTPLPLPGEQGVEVNLGYDNVGTGNVQGKTPPPLKQTPPPPKPKVEPLQTEPKSAPEAKQEQENLTQNTEEAPTIEKKKPEKKKEVKPKEVKKVVPKKLIEKKKPEVKKEEPKPEPKQKEKPVEKPKPVVNKKALFKGNKNRTGAGTNQGTGKEAGDQGKPHGFEDSNKYNGQGGKGNGPAYDLGGRGAKYLDRPSSAFAEAGTIVVSIWVDRSGKVIKALVKEKGTTIIDAGLRRIAIHAAKSSTFIADPEAAELQRGSITYNFIK